jgi:chorismate mutase / prephenate dehydratase
MNLSQLRKQIDRLDDQIVKTLNRRLQLAERIGTVKAQNGSGVYDRSREKEVLSRLTRKKGRFTQGELHMIYRAILRASRAQQKRALKSSVGLKRS